MNRKKVGIMGGTFDPIHNGHLLIAEYSKTALDLNEVLFIPIGIASHKDKNVVLKNTYRYDMTLLAINSNINFNLSTIEMERKEASYTIDTIEQLQSTYRNVDFYFILGSDSLLQIHRWKDFERLLNLCNFIVVKRPNYNNKLLEERINKYNAIYKGDIYLLDTPLINISSTKVRDMVKKGLSINYMVPKPVEIYIHKNKLYRD